ncbi:MAG: hypothetical protein ABFS37_09015 [Acidobacteriota bacterium]
MKIDTNKKLTGVTLNDLKELESETKKFSSKIKRAKKQLEKAEAKKQAQEVLKAAKETLKAKEADLREALTKMGYTKEQIKEAVKAMLQTTSKPAPKAKRNRGPAKYIYTHPKTKEIYTAGKPPKWYQDMSTQQRAKIRKDNPARIMWEKQQA